MLELYNSTDTIKRIPRYRYNGTYTFMPFEAKPIEDDWAWFFKPYYPVGIYVRVRKEKIDKVVKVVKTEESKEIKEIKQENGVKDITVNTDKPVEKTIVKDETKEIKEVEKVKETKEAEKVVQPTETTETIEKVVATEPTEKVEKAVGTEKGKKEKKYTEADLQEKSLVQLREIANSLGIDKVASIRKKDTIKDMILEKQKQ